LLKDFEEHEKMRLEHVKDYIQKFLDLWNPIVPSSKQSNDRLQAKIKDVDVRSDLNLYVEQNRPESDQPPARAQYLSFDGAVVQDVGGSSSSSSSTAIVPARELKKEPKEKKEKPDKFKIGLGKKKETKEEEDAKKKEKEKEKDVKEKDKITSVETQSKPVIKSTSEKTVTARTDTVEHPPASMGGDETSSSGEKKTAKSDTTVSTPMAPNNPPSAGSSAVLPKSDKLDSELMELVTIYAYEATEENELTFEEGETIYLIEKDESGWWRGRNKKGVEGVFPSNFVEVVGEEGGGGGSGTVEINADFTALYDYEAEDDTELTIKEGEVLHVISETDGWYFGSNSQGLKGNFPSNFVERVEK